MSATQTPAQTETLSAISDILHGRETAEGAKRRIFAHERRTFATDTNREPRVAKAKAKEATMPTTKTRKPAAPKTTVVKVIPSIYRDAQSVAPTNKTLTAKLLEKMDLVAKFEFKYGASVDLTKQEIVALKRYAQDQAHTHREVKDFSIATQQQRFADKLAA
jgi:hypothetical protein